MGLARNAKIEMESRTGRRGANPGPKYEDENTRKRETKENPLAEIEGAT